MGGREMGGDLDELSTLYQYDPIRERWAGVDSSAALARYYALISLI